MTSRSVRRARHLGGPSRLAFGNASRLVPHEQTAADRDKSSEPRHRCQRLLLRINLKSIWATACSNLLATGKSRQGVPGPALAHATRQARKARDTTGRGRQFGPIRRAIQGCEADQSRADELGLKTCDQQPFGNADGHFGQPFSEATP